MPINFTQTLKTFDGAVMTEVAAMAEGAPGVVDITLSRVCGMALLGNTPNEPSADVDAHLDRFMLAMKIKDNKAADLSIEEIALIKARVARSYNNAVLAGQAIAMLDPGAVAARTGKTKKAA